MSISNTHYKCYKYLEIFFFGSINLLQYISIQGEVDISLDKDVLIECENMLRYRYVSLYYPVNFYYFYQFNC
jgi:hypothetical protein